MTLGEFKAWLDGLSMAIGDAPTPDQWAAITSKLNQVYEPIPVQIPVLAPNPPLSPSIPWWQPPVWCGPPMTTFGVMKTIPDA